MADTTFFQAALQGGIVIGVLLTIFVIYWAKATKQKPSQVFSNIINAKWMEEKKK